MNKITIDKVLTGAEAAVEAMRQINPTVVPVYPITPQTPIIEGYAKLVADGKVDSEYVTAESEHSVMGIAVGAAASGVRVMTASSSVGLAYMNEMLAVAGGMRLPIIMNTPNRALSAPISIHCDHSDTMSLRDYGWIQLYSENATEVYENNILALKIAEEVNLPAMICQDGFFTSHSLVNVTVLSDESAKKIIGEYRPTAHLLNPDKPVTMGAGHLPDTFFEVAIEREEAMESVFDLFDKWAENLSALTGANINPVELYGDENPEYVIVSLNSTAGVVKDVVDDLRAAGKKVAGLKIRLFRPFPYLQIIKALRGAKRVAVLDRSFSYGASGPVAGEIKSVLYNVSSAPEVFAYTYGLGGREITVEHIAKVFDDLAGDKQESGYLK